MKAEPGPRASFRLVIDTNVWISAALNPTGVPAAVVRRAVEQLLPVMTEDTFLELQQRLWRPKFDRYISTEARQRVLAGVRGACLFVSVPDSLAQGRWCRDPEDDQFIRTALAGQAKWLVTGDDDLLVLAGTIAGIDILSPASAMGKLAD